jgi:hypothetical protein
MPTTNTDLVATDDDGPDETIGQYCDRKHISRATFHKQQRLGIGPKLTRYPHSNMVRISRKASRENDALIAELAQQEDAKLERQRRVEQASAAGKAAALSPRHVSRRSPR